MPAAAAVVSRCVRACFPFLTTVLAWASFAAEPVLDGLFPAGGARGTTNVVTAAGKFDPWPPKIWVSSPGLVFNAETNKGKFSLEIAADAVTGPGLVRF